MTWTPSTEAPPRGSDHEPPARAAEGHGSRTMGGHRCPRRGGTRERAMNSSHRPAPGWEPRKRGVIGIGSHGTQSIRFQGWTRLGSGRPVLTDRGGRRQGDPPTSCREEKSLLMVLYSSTDPMYINRRLPGPRPPTKFTREGHTPRPGPGKGPGTPDLALNKNPSVLPSGVTLGPRVPSRICADRRTRARGSGVAEMTSCPGSARTSLGGPGPQLVRLLRGPGVAASRGPRAAGSGLASAAFS